MKDFVINRKRIRRLDADLIASEIRAYIPHIATNLRRDVYYGLLDACKTETNPRGKQVLSQLVDNAHVAADDFVPICQDTGTVWVLLEVNPSISVPGNIFSKVDEAVAQSYARANLRMSVVEDALVSRVNTGTNTPAFCDLKIADIEGARLSIMLKGGGSDNASRVVMLPPGAGREGIEKAVLECVREKAANACPPLIVGLGIGSTFDHVGGLAKRSLLRPINEEGANSNEEIAAFEQHLLEAINATGIGPAALGGKTTALAVRITTAPCHIAALPLAINLGCSAMRSAVIEFEM